MIHQANDFVVATETLHRLADELADILDYEHAPKADFPFATKVWVDPNQIPVPNAKHKYVHGGRYRLLTVGPRQLMVAHEDYIVWVTVDSTYKQWMVYSNGNPNELERKLSVLWNREDSAWKNIRSPWMADVANRGSMTRQKWAGSTKQTARRSHPDNLVTPPDSSTRKTTQTVPTFGDLSSLAKHSRRKKA
jgi:hypothetical protein